MTDRVFIRHPDRPERNGYVSQTAFDVLWSKKGFIVDEPETVSADDLNAELDRRAGIEPADADSAAPVQAGDDAPDDEKARLTAQLEDAGVVVDGRWGLKRLRAEAANLADDDRSCSVCDDPAVYEIVGAPEEKGNLACEEHRGMWPLSQARRLDGDEDFD